MKSGAAGGDILYDAACARDVNRYCRPPCFIRIPLAVSFWYFVPAEKRKGAVGANALNFSAMPFPVRCRGSTRGPDELTEAAFQAGLVGGERKRHQDFWKPGNKKLQGPDEPSARKPAQQKTSSQGNYKRRAGGVLERAGGFEFSRGFYLDYF